MFVAERYMYYNTVTSTEVYEVSKVTKDCYLVDTEGGYQCRFKKREMGWPKDLAHEQCIVFRNIGDTEEEAIQKVNEMVSNCLRKASEHAPNEDYFYFC